MLPFLSMPGEDTCQFVRHKTWSRSVNQAFLPIAIIGNVSMRPLVFTTRPDLWGSSTQFPETNRFFFVNPRL